MLTMDTQGQIIAKPKTKNKNYYHWVLGKFPFKY